MVVTQVLGSPGTPSRFIKRIGEEHVYGETFQRWGLKILRTILGHQAWVVEQVKRYLDSARKIQNYDFGQLQQWDSVGQ